MNFYPHHIGDYLTATVHLSWVEDCAYRRLLDLYYSREKCLPADKNQVYRLARASSKDERQAVETVLDEFFELTDSGWSHRRCNDEIEKNRAAVSRIARLRDGGSYRRFRSLVLQRDGHKCSYCGAVDVRLQLDHIFPRSRGGSDTPDNLTPACKPCNTSKGAKLLQEWRP